MNKYITTDLLWILTPLALMVLLTPAYMLAGAIWGVRKGFKELWQ
jgi:hypothetical protein